MPGRSGDVINMEFVCSLLSCSSGLKSHTRQEVYFTILVLVFFPGKAVVLGMLSQLMSLTFWAGLVS